MGTGVVDRLFEVGVNVYPFNGAEKPRDQRQYKNRRTEAWFEFAKRIESREIELIDDDKLIMQLSNQPLVYHSNGQYQLMSKKEMKRKGMSSPDRADAVVMCYEVMEWVEREQVLRDDVYKRIFEEDYYIEGGEGYSWMAS